MRVKGIIEDKQLDDDVLLNSEKPLVKLLSDSAGEELPFPKPDFELGEGIMGEGNLPPCLNPSSGTRGFSLYPFI